MLEDPDQYSGKYFFVHRRARWNTPWAEYTADKHGELQATHHPALKHVKENVGSMTGRLFVTETPALRGPRWIVNFPTKQQARPVAAGVGGGAGVGTPVKVGGGQKAGKSLTQRHNQSQLRS